MRSSGRHLSFEEFWEKALLPTIRWVIEYSGAKFILTKFTGKRPNDPNFKEPPSGVLWLVGIYVAAFGVASQIHNSSFQDAQQRPIKNVVSEWKRYVRESPDELLLQQRGLYTLDPNDRRKAWHFLLDSEGEFLIDTSISTFELAKVASVVSFFAHYAQQEQCSLSGYEDEFFIEEHAQPQDLCLAQAAFFSSNRLTQVLATSPFVDPATTCRLYVDQFTEHWLMTPVKPVLLDPVSVWESLIEGLVPSVDPKDQVLPRVINEVAEIIGLDIAIEARDAGLDVREDRDYWGFGVIKEVSWAYSAALIDSVESFLEDNEKLLADVKRRLADDPDNAELARLVSEYDKIVEQNRRRLLTTREALEQREHDMLECRNTIWSTSMRAAVLREKERCVNMIGYMTCGAVRYIAEINGRGKDQNN